jgi:alkyl hydroperoxide reductase subunit F
VKVEEVPGQGFKVTTEQGNAHVSKTVIVASGARRRRLKVAGEEQFEGKGVAFCSTCDAPFFSNQVVAAVGGGNAALETVINLLPYAKKIYFLIRGQELGGDPMTWERVMGSERMNLIRNVEVQEILGGRGVTGLRYRDKESDHTQELPVSGVFVEIGSMPNATFIRDLVETNEAGEIVIDHRSAQTSKQGIFAVGDVTSDAFKRLHFKRSEIQPVRSKRRCVARVEYRVLN